MLTTVHIAPRSYTTDLERARIGSAPLQQPHRSSAHLHSLRSSSEVQRCMFSKPAALLACVVLTLLWLWFTAHPLFKSPVRVVHALHIDIPPQAHAHAGVLVDRDDDLAAISRWQSVLHHLHHQEALPSEDSDPSASAAGAAGPLQAPFSCYGVHAQRGRRRYMEDTYAVYLNHELHYSSAAEKHLRSRDTEDPKADTHSPWALFGVFDGHGGELASEYAASYMLPSLHSTLLHNGHTGATALQPAKPLLPAVGAPIAAPESAPATASAPPTGASESASPSTPLNVSSCFVSTFRTLDAEFLDLIARPQERDDGSTALVAGFYYRGGVEGPDQSAGSTDGVRRSPFQLVVANLGDCRAIFIQPAQTTPLVDSTSSTTNAISADVREHAPSVPLLPADTATAPAVLDSLPSPSSTAPLVAPLASGGAIVSALSLDHKPDSALERSWIESQVGGFVSEGGWRDVARVQGVLAVSRALGDLPLKPMVRSEPDVRIIELQDLAEDELLQGTCEFDPLEQAAFDSCGGATSSTSSSSTSASALVTKSGPLLLLASDGFWDVFSNEEAASAALDFLSASASPAPSSSSASSSVPSPPLLSALAHHLVAQAYLRGSMDNISLIAIDVRCIQRWLKQQARNKAIAAAQQQQQQQRQQPQSDEQLP